MTGSYVHRSLIDIDKLMQNELTRQLYEGQPSGFCNTVNRNTGVMIVSYPCRSDKVMNLAIFHGTRESEEGVDEWNASADIKDVLSLVDEGFHPAWVELVKVAGPNNWKFFPVSKRDPLDRASKGKVVIIGDAAHGEFNRSSAGDLLTSQLCFRLMLKEGPWPWKTVLRSRCCSLTFSLVTVLRSCCCASRT